MSIQTKVDLNQGLLGTKEDIGYTGAGDAAGVPAGGRREQVWPHGRFLRVPTKTQAGTPDKHMTHLCSGK